MQPFYVNMILMSSLFACDMRSIWVYVGGMSKLGERIKAAREAQGLDQADLAAAIGYDQSSISSIESGRTTSPRNWRKLADVLAIPHEEFRALMIQSSRVAGKDTRLPAGVRRPVDLPLARVPNISVMAVPPHAGVRDVPVYGRAQGGPDGTFMFNGEVIGWEMRPPILDGVPEAYAVYVDGESMYPRYKPGETVWVNPNRAPRRGQDVIVQLRPDASGDAPSGFIKEFVSRTGTALVLHQFNPDGDITYDLGEVLSVHPIVFAQRD